MAGPTGFEPAISSVTGWHVGPLHHGPAEATAAEYTKARARSGIALGTSRARIMTVGDQFGPLSGATPARAAD